ncbi:hypothetical protein HK405_007769, partial [Cladochytrium tenue]
SARRCRWSVLRPPQHLQRRRRTTSGILRPCLGRQRRAMNSVMTTRSWGCFGARRD